MSRMSELSGCIADLKAAAAALMHGLVPQRRRMGAGGSVLPKRRNMDSRLTADNAKLPLPDTGGGFLIQIKGGFQSMRDFTIDLIWAKIQAAITVIGGWLGYFLGGLDGLMIALVIFVVLDYVTGIMCAIADKKLSSSVGFKGICRKVLIFLLVGVAHIVDLHVVGSGSVLRGAVVCFYLSNEGVSMLENAAHLGLPVPEKLKVILEQLHDREAPGDPTDNNTNDGQ